MIPTPFPDRPRFDARDMVLGRTRYAADRRLAGMLHAMTVPARIAKGTVTSLGAEAALRVPGVVRVLTPDDFPEPPPSAEDGPPPPPPTLTSTVSFRGEPIALVIAESLEAAIEGAEAMRPVYAEEPFQALMDGLEADREEAEPYVAGDAAAVMARAAVTVSETYESPTQHHNPIELMATVAEFRDGRLSVHECSQSVGLAKYAVFAALRIDPAVVDVRSPHVGGSFGQKGLAQRQTALIAQAALLTGRPVKLVMPRGQIFHVAAYRPRSRHRVELGATGEGSMIAARYDAIQEQSRQGFFPAAEYHEAPIRLYGIENYLGTGADIRLDRQAPGWMRAPHAQASCFAFESAVDELAWKLGQDPLAFRLANDAARDPRTGRPLSSRFMRECLEEGARRFGWKERVAQPGSMTAEDGTLIGWGVACGAYPSSMPPAIARLRVGADGRTRFAVSGHEMGQGIRTAIASVLIEELSIDPVGLEIVIADTTSVPQHMTAGSWGTAGCVPATMKAVERMRSAVAELVGGQRIAGNLHRQLAMVRRPSVEVEVSELAPGQKPEALEELKAGGIVAMGPEYPAFTSMSYGAHFVEVRVEPRTRRVRVPRVVSIADCGRVISPRTAASQVYGGVIWGIGASLRERTEVDPRFGGYLNSDIADYVVAVNADIEEIDVGLIDRPDLIANRAGLKGLGQVTMAGVSAAVANAVFHATGKRLRSLPMRIEDLL